MSLVVVVVVEVVEKLLWIAHTREGGIDLDGIRRKLWLISIASSAQPREKQEVTKVHVSYRDTQTEWKSSRLRKRV